MIYTLHYSAPECAMTILTRGSLRNCVGAARAVMAFKPDTWNREPSVYTPGYVGGWNRHAGLLVDRLWITKQEDKCRKQ